MTKFTDSNGTEHEIKIHLGTIERAMEATGVNILEWGMHRADDDPMATLLFRLRGEPLLLAGIVWATVRTKAATEDDRYAFFEALNGDSLWDARVALEEAIVNFTRGPEKDHLLMVRKTLGEMMDTVLKTQIQAAKDPRVARAVTKELDKLSRKFGDYLESLESAPTDTPTAN